MGIKLLHTMSDLQKQLENFRLICSKDNIDLKDAFIFSDILKYYFINDRPQVFSNYLIKSPSFFSKLLKASPFVTGTKIASDYFLFYYTLTKEDYFDVQNEIYDYIAIPYKKWVNDSKKFLNISPLIIEKPKKKITFFSLHAVLSGI